MVALKHLAAIGECLFDLSLDGPRLQSILFGSRDNMSYARNYYSCDGEVVCERWNISACHKYLWVFFSIGCVTVAVLKKC